MKEKAWDYFFDWCPVVLGCWTAIYISLDLRRGFLRFLACVGIGMLLAVCGRSIRQEDWRRKYFRLYNDPAIRELRRQLLLSEEDLLPPDAAKPKERYGPH
jgi:hypothetical protein